MAIRIFRRLLMKNDLLPGFDLAFSALIEDLTQRGMLDETLVVWTGEMGRTPKVGQSVPGGAGHAGECGAAQEGPARQVGGRTGAARRVVHGRALLHFCTR